MIKAICLFMTLLLGLSTHAQPNYDSLMVIWNDESNHDTTRLIAMNDLLFAKGYLWTGRDSAAKLANMQFELAEAKGFKRQMFYALRNQGLVFALKVMNKEALEYDLKRLEIAKDISFNEGVAECYLSLGHNYSNLGDYPNALASFLESLSFYKESDEKLHIAVLLEEIGGIYALQTNLLEAFHYFQQSLIAFQEIPNEPGVARALVKIGELYEMQGEYIKALEYYNQNLKMWQELWETKYSKGEQDGIGYSLKLLIGDALVKIGKVYEQQNMTDKALINYLEGLAIYEESSSGMGLFYVQLDVGNAYLQKGELDSAMNYFNRSLEIAKSHTSSHYLMAVLPFIGDVYAEQGNYSKAIEVYQQSLSIAEQMSKKGRLIGLYQKIGIVYRDNGNFSEAVQWCTKGLDLAKEARSIADQIAACGCIYTANEELGNYKEALLYFQMMTLLNDSIPTEATNKKLMQREFDEKILSDSLRMVRNKLDAELEYQSTLSSERNTRNILLLVGLGILAAAVALYWRMRHIRRTNNELAEKNILIAMEKDRAEASEKAKEQFFNNISHEFRTPLTLIMGPLEEVLDGNIDEKSRPNLKMMLRSVSRLQGMINELLDLSKLEYGKIKLKVGEQNIVSLTKQYLQSFESLADQKNIKLAFKSQAEEYKLWVDAEQIRKVLANLLSNAFKFTDTGDRIEVDITASIETVVGGYKGVQIKVSDTGKGIPANQIGPIFDRFYQVVEDAQTHSGGSGIGLALTKELVELHHGTITAESHVGEGTCFTVFIPFGKEQFSEDEIVMDENSKTATVGLVDEWVIKEEISGHVSEDEISKKSEKPILLIVEDNPDMMAYISSHIEKKYELLKARDGEQGLAMALDHVPDLIISDVMMPRMDGIAMTERLKTDQRTSHIPIIMLTARASVESKIEGLETGVDDYVTKPFDARELQIRVKNLIDQRETLRQHFAKELNAGIPITKSSKLPSMDQKFIKKAVEIVNQHLSENEYDVNQFAAEMALSRSQLHRKIKALTGKSATEFIRTIRLNKAAELLMQETDNVTQIAYDTGFSSLSWFAKAFKEQFGLSPSEYAKSKKSV